MSPRDDRELVLGEVAGAAARARGVHRVRRMPGGVRLNPATSAESAPLSGSAAARRAVMSFCAIAMAYDFAMSGNSFR